MTWEGKRNNQKRTGICAAIEPMEKVATGRPEFLSSLFVTPVFFPRELPGRRVSQLVKKLVLLFSSLLAIPLASQSCLDATLLTGLQVVGVTLHLFDDVLLLYLPFEPAQRIFERLAFLNANLCPKIPPPNMPSGSSRILEGNELWNRQSDLPLEFCEKLCSFHR